MMRVNKKFVRKKNSEKKEGYDFMSFYHFFLREKES